MDLVLWSWRSDEMPDVLFAREVLTHLTALAGTIQTVLGCIMR
jgi:hypothetical protein